MALPLLDEIYEEDEDQFNILAINLTYGDSIKRVREKRDSLGIDMPILLDEDGDVATSYSVIAVPTIVVINEDGVIEYIQASGLSKEKMLELLEN